MRTDNSMRMNYHKVIRMMCEISKDWFTDYKDNIDSWPTEEQRTIKLFLRSYKEVIDMIDVVQRSIDLNSSRFDLYDNLQGVQERLSMFGPIVEYPEKPRFALNDFITRWLRAF